MKNILMAGLAFVFLGLDKLNAQTTPPIQKVDTADRPVITFETDTIDWGVVENGSQMYRIFHFTNTGKEPLVISSVTTSDPHYGYVENNKPYKSGETGTIKVLYDTHRVGKTCRYLTVHSNAKNLEKRIWIKVTVLPPKKEDPVFPFGK